MQRAWVAIPLALLYACGPDTAKPNSPSYLSITTDPPTVAKAQPAFDSLTIEQSRIAYGALRFGMTEAQANQLPKAEREGVRHIGSKRYSINCLYNRDKQLYLVGIEGMPVGADYLGTEVLQQVYNLSAAIRAHYGMPRYLGRFPARFDLRPGHITWIESWAVGDKMIKIGVSEVATGAKYKATCWIYHRAMREAEEAATTGRESIPVSTGDLGL